MADNTILLGIDVGSSGTKAVLVDPTTGVLCSASSETALSSEHPGWAEANPAQWLDNVGIVVADLLSQSGFNASSIGAVAVSGMVPAVVCLDGEGNAVRNAILQNDARAVVEIDELQRELADIDLLSETGSVLTQQSVAPTLRWLARHEPDVFAATERVVGSYDFIAMQLGARVHVESNWALESGLYDRSNVPQADVLSAIGLEGSLLANVLSPGTVVGEVDDRGQSLSGLALGTPIVVGGADHVLSAYGAGLTVEGDWLIKLGGAGDVLAVSQTEVLDPRLYLDRHPVEGLYLPNGCMATSGSLLRWLQHLVGDADLLTLDAEAEGCSPSALLCLPYFLGEKSPLHDPDLRGAFVGLHLGTSRGDMHRAALEAIAYGFRQHQEIFQGLGIPTTSARVTNGGSKSTLWKRILASVLQTPLTPVLDHPGASFGAAIAAGVGIRAVTSWDSIQTLVHYDSPIEPDASLASVYDEGYEQYLSLGAAIRPFSHALARKDRS